jgi:hypothetical protein
MRKPVVVLALDDVIREFVEQGVADPPRRAIRRHDIDPGDLGLLAAIESKGR